MFFESILLSSNTILNFLSHGNNYVIPFKSDTFLSTYKHFINIIRMLNARTIKITIVATTFITTTQTTTSTAAAAATTTTTVSYTHLDVYKRQVRYCSFHLPLMIIYFTITFLYGTFCDVTMYNCKENRS